MTGSSRPARPGRDALVERLVRWGRLEFADFARLDPATASALFDPADPDWVAALNNAPQVWTRLPIADVRSSSRNLHSALCSLTSAEIRSAQRRLVRRHWRALLVAKAPALYDALPWHDVDIGPLLRGRRLWQTRFLLAGDHASVTLCRLRRSAGVYVVEPNLTLAGYLERKAELEKAKKTRILRARLDRTGLPDRAADLAIIGLEAGLAMVELERVAAEVVLLECDPLSGQDIALPAVRGYRELSVSSRFGPCRAWRRQAL